MTSQEADKVPAVGSVTGVTKSTGGGNHILSNLLRFGYDCEDEEKALVKDQCWQMMLCTWGAFLFDKNFKIVIYFL